MKRSMAFVEARRQKILETLAANPECKVQDLADAQNVSTLTIRRDLDALARRGFLKRFYGGAALARTARPPKPPRGRAQPPHSPGSPTPPPRPRHRRAVTRSAHSVQPT